jgi:hypothetical protein
MGTTANRCRSILNRVESLLASVRDELGKRPGRVATDQKLIAARKLSRPVSCPGSLRSDRPTGSGQPGGTPR